MLSAREAVPPPIASNSPTSESHDNLMTHLFQPGQKYRLTNPDYSIFEEEWTVVEVNASQVTFSIWRRWHIDREYMQPTSTDPYWGKVIQEDTNGALIVDAHNTTYGSRYHVEGNKVTQLPRSPILRYVNRVDADSTKTSGKTGSGT